MALVSKASKKSSATRIPVVVANEDAKVRDQKDISSLTPVDLVNSSSQFSCFRGEDLMMLQSSFLSSSQVLAEIPVIRRTSAYDKTSSVGWQLDEILADTACALSLSPSEGELVLSSICKVASQPFAISKSKITVCPSCTGLVFGRLLEQIVLG
uniref:Uncharacterized protein n=1 Tax=Cucumis sativus TaxID=3659 RepID=A0A0A0K8V1_CUCSA